MGLSKRSNLSFKTCSERVVAIRLHVGGLRALGWGEDPGALVTSVKAIRVGVGFKKLAENLNLRMQILALIYLSRYRKNFTANYKWKITSNLCCSSFNTAKAFYSICPKCAFCLSCGRARMSRGCVALALQAS